MEKSKFKSSNIPSLIDEGIGIQFTNGMGQTYTTKPFPSLKKIDPCEGCTRNCHDCGFKEEHFKLMDQATRENTRDNYLKIHEMPISESVPHDHGTGWDDCNVCDTEITDGKLVDITINGRHSIIHICNSCYLDPDFQENIRKDHNVKIRNY